MDATAHALADRLDRLEAANRELTERLAAVEAENASLRAAPSTLGLPTGAAPTVGIEDLDGGATVETSGDGVAVGRRHALRKGLALAGAAAAGTVALGAQPAAAANGDPLRLGQSNTATNATYHAGAPFHTSVTNGISLYGIASNGIGGYFSGRTSNLWLAPPSGRLTPTKDTGSHTVGEVVMDTTARLWLCIEGGAPGKWRSLGGRGSAGAFFPFLAPRRAYDSRPGTTPGQGPKTPLPANGTRTISLAALGLADEPTSGVLLNILLVNAQAGAGNFTVWATGQPLPQSNTMVWGGNAGRFCSMAFSAVDSQARINLRASLQTHIVVDVVGYYR